MLQSFELVQLPQTAAHDDEPLDAELSIAATALLASIAASSGHVVTATVPLVFEDDSEAAACVREVPLSPELY